MIKIGENNVRLRNIRGSREVIAESSYVIHEEESRAGTWKEIFGNDHPVCIEIYHGDSQKKSSE